MTVIVIVGVRPKCVITAKQRQNPNKRFECPIITLIHKTSIYKTYRRMQKAALKQGITP